MPDPVLARADIGWIPVRNDREIKEVGGLVVRGMTVRRPSAVPVTAL
jgi:hypothetical protein